jgi:predicted DNA-binding protein
MVRLTPDLYEALRTNSEQEERTVAQTVRLAVRQFLENNELLPA